MTQKQELYERFLLNEIRVEEYKTQNSVIDAEMNRLKQVRSALAAQTAQMQLDKKTKSARTKLAQEITEAHGLTPALAEALIDKVYVYPENQVENIWKIKDFCIQE